MTSSFNKQVITGMPMLLIVMTFLTTTAQATSFNWKYSFSSGESAQGMLDGDIQPDGDTIIVNSIMGTYTGDPALSFTVLQPGTQRVSFSGALMDLVAFDTLTFDTFMSYFSGLGFASVSIDLSFVEDDPWDPNSWNISQKNPTIPEPSTLLLFGTGMLGLLAWARRKKNSAI